MSLTTHTIDSHELINVTDIFETGEMIEGHEEPAFWQPNSLAPILIAGPCAIETRETTLEIAQACAAMGSRLFRAMLWKPRTRPNTFQGVGKEGLDWVREAKDKTGLRTITEITDRDQLETTKGVTDVLQIGSRNAQNFELLRAAGQDGRPVLLKRGMSMRLEEWKGAAEYVGPDKVMLCERGIRAGTEGGDTRNTLDLGVALVAKQKLGLPVIIDPSHAAGRRDIIPSLSHAAAAAGFDGLMLEVHPTPDKALSDAEQQITPAVAEGIYRKCLAIREALDATINMRNLDSRLAERGIWNRMERSSD